MSVTAEATLAVLVVTCSSKAFGFGGGFFFLFSFCSGLVLVFWAGCFSVSSVS